MTSHLTRLTSLWPPFAISGGSPPPPPAPPAEMGCGLRWLMGGGGATVVLPYDLADALLAWLRANVPLQPGQADDLGWSKGLNPKGARVWGRVQLVAETDSYMSADTRWAEGLIQVSVFAPTESLARTPANAARDGLKNYQLRFQDGQVVTMRQSSRRLMPPDAMTGTGADTQVWQDIRTFAFIYCSST